MIDYLDNVHSAKYFVAAAGLMIKGLDSYSKAQASKENDDGEKKKLTPAEKKRLAKLKQKEEEELQYRKLFAIEGHIFSTELRAKFDLTGE